MFFSPRLNEDKELKLKIIPRAWFNVEGLNQSKHVRPRFRVKQVEYGEREAPGSVVVLLCQRVLWSMVTKNASQGDSSLLIQTDFNKELQTATDTAKVTPPTVYF